MVPELTAKMLSSVPKCKKAVTCLMEKVPGLTRLLSGVNYGAVPEPYGAVLTVW